MPFEDQGLVLIVENERHDVARFVEALDRLGVAPERIVTFDRADVAVQWLGDNKWTDEGIRLVLLDWKLTGTGASVLNAVRQIPRLRFTPVVVVSRSTFDGDVLAAYESGVSAFVHKPSQLIEYERRLDTTLAMYLSVVELPDLSVEDEVQVQA
jgi:CheY-like chemotaxis protein